MSDSLGEIDSEELALDRLMAAYGDIPPFDLTKERNGAGGLQERGTTRLNFLEECLACKHNINPSEREELDRLEVEVRSEAFN